MGIFDEAVAEIEATQEPPVKIKPEPKTKQIEQLKKFNIVKGDLAKAMAPSLGNKQSLFEEASLDVEAQDKGYRPARPQVLANQEDVDLSKQTSKSLFDEAKEEISQPPISIGVDDKKDGFFNIGQSFVKGKLTDYQQRKVLSGVDTALTALSVDEHAIVTGLNKAVGFDNKQDFGDNTWTNFYRDLYGKDSPYRKDGKVKTRFGEFETDIKDDLTITAMGLASSIALSPTTYLTFGTSTAAKVGLKGALTKEGQKLIQGIVKETGAKKIAEESARIGKELSMEAKNALIQKTKFEVEQMVAKKFGEINAVNKDLNVIEQIANLPARIQSKGGAKLEVPFVGREVNIVSGKQWEKAKELYKSATVKIMGEPVLEGAETVAELNKSGLLKYTQAIMKNTGAKELVDDAAKAKDFLGKHFIPDYGVKPELVSYFDRAGEHGEKLLENIGSTKYSQADAEVAYMLSKWKRAEEEAVQATRSVQKATKNAFKHLDKTQQTEFMDTLIEASVKSEETKEFAPVIAKSKDPKVQDAIDRWVGQGKYKKEDSFSAKLADLSKITEKKKIPIWVPGIIEEMATKHDLKIPFKLEEAKRKFLSQRMDPSLAERYTRDPVKAIGHRLTEISYANIQDKFFKNIVDKKLGGLKEFDSYDEALRAGYAPIRRPMADLADPAMRATEKTYYVQKEFADQYYNLIRQQGVNSPVLSAVDKYLAPVTAQWKKAVTSVFPSFHAGNAVSNVIMNSMRIGGHAVDPKKMFVALKATAMRNIEKDPVGIADKVYQGAARLVLGKNLDKEMTTAIGEKISIRSLLKEAEETGAIGNGMYVADMFGASQEKTISEIIGSGIAKHANPFSQDWTPSVFGKKFGDAIETQARLVNYLTHRMKGLDPKTAANEVNEALFDYSKLTGFERTLNNSIMPFYTFSRKNLANHYKILKSNPGVVANQMKFFRDLAPSEKEMEDMPEWARQRFILKVRGEFLTNFRVPIEDIIDLASEPDKQVLLRLNPLLRYAGEEYTGKDVFSERPIEAVNAANEFKPLLEIIENKKTPEFVKKSLEPIRNFLNLQYDTTKQDKVIGDPRMLHLLRSSFTSRFQSVIGQLTKEDKSNLEKAIRFLSGIVRIEPDPSLAQSIATKKELEILKEKAQRTNVARPAPVLYFVGDPIGSKIANDFVEMIKKVPDVGEKRRIREEAEEIFKDIQRERVRQ